MRILHTADWHIGKQLYKERLTEDIQLFFVELLDIIQAESIDVVLIAGDVFDLANPSNADKALYFDILKKLRKLDVITIITAGNHDSARLLDAPSGILSQLDIHVIGSTDEFDKLIIPVGLNKDKAELVVFAAPYLRERDVRTSVAGEKYEEKLEALRQGIIAFYQKGIDKIRKEYPNIPTIALGHLYMQGAQISDSERDIQIGNQAGIGAAGFDIGFDYIALGHIHRPQTILKDKIRYSGSPIALSFSERSDKKQVIIIDLDHQGIQNIQSYPLKQYRILKRISGNLKEVKQALQQFDHQSPLPALVELHVVEEKTDQAKTLELIDLSQQSYPNFRIVNPRIEFKDKVKNKLLEQHSASIDTLRPLDVFRSKLDMSIQAEEDKKALENVFSELLDLWQEQQEG